MLATCYNKLKDYENAAKYYAEALEKYPDCQYAFRTAYEVGKAYRRAGNFNQAVYWFDRQLERYPENLAADRALFDKSLVYMFDIKDYQKAIEALQQYRESYPKGDSIDIISYELARSYEKLGKKAEAVAELKRGLSEYPDCDYVGSYRKKLAELQ
jgi:tetratricopeptide (TPR) repeat protein